MSINVPATGFHYVIPQEDRTFTREWRERKQPISTGTASRFKQAEHDRIAADIAEFERKGGRIERLGNTPLSGSAQRQARLEKLHEQRARGRAAQRHNKGGQDEEE